MRLFCNPLKLLSKTRDRKFDLLKLFAILLVIFDHCLQRLIPGCQNSSFYNLIFITQMPIFFFVSGYFFFKNLDKANSIKSMFYRVYKLLISHIVPFLSFSCFNYLISNPSCSFFKFILDCFVNPELSLWFLWVLFFMNFFMLFSMYCSNKLVKNNFIFRCFISVLVYFFPLIVISISFIYFGNYFCNKLLVYYSLFYLAGYLFRLLKFKFMSNNKVMIFICIISFAVFLFVALISPSFVLADETIQLIILRGFGSIFSIVFFYSLSYFLSMNKVFNNISKFGIFTLEFYYVHLLVLSLYTNFSLTLEPYFLPVFYILVIFISSLIVFLLKSFFLTDFVCFGKIIKDEYTN